MQLLYQRSLSGIASVSQCMQRLLYHCHRLLFTQVADFAISRHSHSDDVCTFCIVIIMACLWCAQRSI
jgi:hypothetical protein